MKLKLKTRQKEMQDRIAKKRIERERKDYVNKFPKGERKRVEDLLTEMEVHHRAQNKNGILSLMAIGAFFIMYGYGFLTWNIFTQIVIGTAFALFAYFFARMVLSAWRGDRCKRTLAHLHQLRREDKL